MEQAFSSDDGSAETHHLTPQMNETQGDPPQKEINSEFVRSVSIALEEEGTILSTEQAMQCEMYFSTCILNMMPPDWYFIFNRIMHKLDIPTSIEEISACESDLNMDVETLGEPCILDEPISQLTEIDDSDVRIISPRDCSSVEVSFESTRMTGASQRSASKTSLPFPDKIREKFLNKVFHVIFQEGPSTDHEENANRLEQLTEDELTQAFKKGRFGALSHSRFMERIAACIEVGKQDQRLNETTKRTPSRKLSNNPQTMEHDSTNDSMDSAVPENRKRKCVIAKKQKGSKKIALAISKENHSVKGKLRTIDGTSGSFISPAGSAKGVSQMDHSSEWLKCRVVREFDEGYVLMKFGDGASEAHDSSKKQDEHEREPSTIEDTPEDSLNASNNSLIDESLNVAGIESAETPVDTSGLKNSGKHVGRDCESVLPTENLCKPIGNSGEYSALEMHTDKDDGCEHVARQSNRISNISDESLEILLKKTSELGDLVHEIGQNIYAELNLRKTNNLSAENIVKNYYEEEYTFMSSEMTSYQSDDSSSVTLGNWNDRRDSFALASRRESIIEKIKGLASVTMTFDTTMFPGASLDIRTQMENLLSSFETTILDIEKNIEHERQTILDTTVKNASVTYSNIRTHLKEYQMFHEKLYREFESRVDTISLQKQALIDRLETCCHGSPFICEIERALYGLQAEHKHIRSVFAESEENHRKILYYTNWMDTFTQPENIPECLYPVFSETS